MIDNKQKNKLYEYGNYAIDLYFGEKRSGKTLYMTYDGYLIQKRFPKIKVYANYKLNRKYFPNYEYINGSDLVEFYKEKDSFKNTLFLIDELHSFLDSRKFAKGDNQKIGYLIGQMGKRYNIFLGNTHFPNLIDIRLRMYAERINYIRKGLKINGVYRPILNNNMPLSNEEDDLLYIEKKSVIKKLIDFDFIYIQENVKLLKAKQVFDMYDTEEMIVKKDSNNS